jgi:hypothetical protein
MGIHRPAALVAALLLGGCTMVGGPGEEFRSADEPPAEVTPEEVARHLIAPGDIDRYVDFLASDDLRGRGVPSPGLDRAAAWLVEQYQLAGLEPVGDDGGYVQYRPVPGDTLLAPNVVGLFRGSDLSRAGELIVVAADFANRRPGTLVEDEDSIFNGADDNASGTAALVEVLQALSALPEPPPRPVLFLAVGDGADGASGSLWYAEHPTVALEGAAAALVLDRLGANAPDAVELVSDGDPRLAELAAGLASGNRELRLQPRRRLAGGGAPWSGGAAGVLAARGIPTLLVTAGLAHHQGTPADERRRVDADKVARIARLAFLTLHALAAGPEVVPDPGPDAVPDPGP